MSVLAWVIIGVLVLIVLALAYVLYVVLRGVNDLVHGLARAVWGGGRR